MPLSMSKKVAIEFSDEQWDRISPWIGLQIAGSLRCLIGIAVDRLEQLDDEAGTRTMQENNMLAVRYSGKRQKYWADAVKARNKK
jgi:hypothetical protein